MAIRYSQDFNKELARVVRNYNQKLARLEKKDIQTGLERVSIKTIKREYQSRRDLVAYMREMRAFGQRGVERIAFIDRYKKPITEYELSITRARQQRAIRIAEQKIAQAQSVVRTTRGRQEIETLMGTDYENYLQANLEKLKAVRFSTKLPKSEQAKLVRAERAIFSIEKRGQRSREDFYEILVKEISFCGLPMTMFTEIKTKLNKLDAQHWELTENGEEIIVALIENYPRIKEAKSDAERAALKSELTTLINALYNSINEIIDYYSGK